MAVLNCAELVLASASPRRSQLLASLGIAFRTVPSAVEEENWSGRSPAAYARSLAHAKARAVANSFPEAIVVGADTIVVCAGEVLGKPIDDADAARMLRQLSGRRHQVITGLAIVAGSGPLKGQALVSHETTIVEFRHITEREIAAYVASGEPRDKAGAYGIQGKAGLFVARIEGCYFNVVGLPLSRLAHLLTECGVAVF